MMYQYGYHILGQGKGGVVPFSPLRVKHLAQWYRYDAGLYRDAAGTTPATVGQAVGRWENLVGDGYAGRQTNTSKKPQRTALGLYFDGTDDFLEIDAKMYYSNGGVAIYAALEPTGPNSHPFVMDQGFFSNSGFGFQYSTTKHQMYHWGQSLQSTFSRGPHFEVVGWEIDFHDQMRLLQGGEVVATGPHGLGDVNLRGGDDPWRIGMQSKSEDASRCFTGYMKELLIYDKLPTEAERQNLTAYLQLNA